MASPKKRILTEEEKEYKRVWLRAYRKRMRADPEWCAHQNETQKKKYYRNKEEHLAKIRERWAANKERLNAKRNLIRAADIKKARERDKLSYRNKLKSWFARFRRREISLDEFSRRISETYVRAAKRYEARRHLRHRGLVQSGKGDSGARKGATASSKERQ